MTLTAGGAEQQHERAAGRSAVPAPACASRSSSLSVASVAACGSLICLMVAAPSRFANWLSRLIARSWLGCHSTPEAGRDRTVLGPVVAVLASRMWLGLSMQLDPTHSCTIRHAC